MKSNRKDVYAVIDDERDYQDSLWGTPDEHQHGTLEFLAFILDYVQQGIRDFSRNADPTGEVLALHATRKIAALAVASMEQNGALLRQQGRTSPARTDVTPTAAAVQAYRKKKARTFKLHPKLHPDRE